jgi:hypothetical protein
MAEDKKTADEDDGAAALVTDLLRASRPGVGNVFLTLQYLLDLVLSELVDTDGTLASNSDSLVPSQKAVKTAIAAAIANLVGTAPGVLDTLGEISDALNDDANLYATLVALLALKAPIASPAFTGNPTAPTPSPGDNDTSIATTAFVTAAIALVGTGGTEVRGLTFISDTGSTADADNSAGFVWWNNATQGSATTLFFDNLTADAAATPTFFAALGATGFIYLQQSDDATKWQLWKWSAVTAGSGYYKFTVTLMVNAGAIADNKTVYTEFVGAGGGSSAASAVTITDTGNLYAATEVEGALQEVAASVAAVSVSGMTRGLGIDILNVPTFL